MGRQTVLQSRTQLDSKGRRRAILGLCLVFVFFLFAQRSIVLGLFAYREDQSPHLAYARARCRQLSSPPGFQESSPRTVSDRFENGTPPVLIRNARLWTGSRNGTEVIHADMILDKGIIQAIGRPIHPFLQSYGMDLVTIDVKGAWVTPGIVDVHSHLGVSSSPELEGSNDGNSMSGIIQPWLRSLDALNTHDDSYPLSIAGGVTTSLVLPGSANAIGIQLL